MSANPYSQHPHYHGWPAYPYAAPSGFCPSCCHPAPRCVCGWRQCRKEAKELLVTAEARTLKEQAAIERGLVDAVRSEEGAAATVLRETEETVLAGNISRRLKAQTGQGTAFLGGGCCVHLSIEYTSVSESAQVVVEVMDAEGTVLAWVKRGIQPGYYIKEGIISTNPGASLRVIVKDATARVRWCEVFSC